VVCVVDEYGGVCEDVVGPIPGVFVEELEDVCRASNPSSSGRGVVVVFLGKSSPRAGFSQHELLTSTGPLPNGASKLSQLNVMHQVELTSMPSSPIVLLSTLLHQTWL
jgi:hypothetical protein